MGGLGQAWGGGITSRDNKAVGPKLSLRRHFLDKYHAGTTPIVFDACQGSGVLWTRLRAEYQVTYWGVDVKRAAGRLAVDSIRILAQPNWKFDVIDIDTYGSPWPHWTALLPNLHHPATIFLTYGGAGPSVRDPGNAVFERMGLGPLLDRMPPSMRWRLSDLALDYSLAMCYLHALQVVECGVTRAGNALYYGIRLQPEPGARRRPRS